MKNLLPCAVAMLIGAAAGISSASINKTDPDYTLIQTDIGYFMLKGKSIYAVTKMDGILPTEASNKK